MKGETKMNLKSLITVAAVATAGAVLAAYESPVKLCQIKVDSSNANTILALPLVNVGNDGETVNPTNMVLTKGLKAGTFLYTNTGKTKAGWTINTDNGPWEAVTVVDGKIQSGSDSASRGSGVWLTRSGVTSGSAGSVYIYGQISTNAATSTASAASYTMIGNASTNIVRLTALKWDVPPSVGDKVMFIDDSAYGVANEFTCSSSDPVAWTYETITTHTETFGKKTVIVSESTQTQLTSQSTKDPQIYPGQGFFYYRKNTEGTAPKVVW